MTGSESPVIKHDVIMTLPQRRLKIIKKLVTRRFLSIISSKRQAYE